jgi:hypothetical protein
VKARDARVGNTAAVLIFTSLVVGACGGVDPGACEPQNAFPACDQVVVTVDAQNWATAEGMHYSLEMAGGGWPIDAAQGGGVATVDAPDGAEVLMFRVSECRALLQFHAEAGSAWVIELNADGADTRLRDPSKAIAMGPGIVPGALSGCTTK